GARRAASHRTTVPPERGASGVAGCGRARARRAATDHPLRTGHPRTRGTPRSALAAGAADRAGCPRRRGGLDEPRTSMTDENVTRIRRGVRVRPQPGQERDERTRVRTRETDDSQRNTSADTTTPARAGGAQTTGPAGGAVTRVRRRRVRRSVAGPEPHPP